MSEGPAEFKMLDAFLLGALLTLLLTTVPLMIWGVQKWHDQTCSEQFNQAASASDSLSVIRQDSFCRRLLADD